MANANGNSQPIVHCTGGCEPFLQWFMVSQSRTNVHCAGALRARQEIQRHRLCRKFMCQCKFVSIFFPLSCCLVPSSISGKNRLNCSNMQIAFQQFPSTQQLDLIDFHFSSLRQTNAWKMCWNAIKHHIKVMNNNNPDVWHFGTFAWHTTTDAFPTMDWNVSLNFLAMMTTVHSLPRHTHTHRTGGRRLIYTSWHSSLAALFSKCTRTHCVGSQAIQRTRDQSTVLAIAHTDEKMWMKFTWRALSAV